jgi:3-oxoacyl-[acyl-carrier protein] reductase
VSDLDFTGKTALVVGGSSGIGNGIAQAYRQRGADVHVWGTRPNASDYKAAEGSDLTGLTYSCVDVSDVGLIEQHQPTFDTLDILVLSQGTVRYKREEFGRKGWDDVMAVNLDSLRACAMKFYEALVASRGSLIIVSSVAGFSANKGNPAYSASKYGAVGLTRSLGQAWAPEGIRVNGIAPGLVDTKLTKVTTEHPKRREAALATIPAGRFGTPEDMAGAALFLASPLASYVCGQTLIVDGGLKLS